MKKIMVKRSVAETLMIIALVVGLVVGSMASIWISASSSTKVKDVNIHIEKLESEVEELGTQITNMEKMTDELLEGQ